MKAILIALTVLTTLAAGCVVVPVPVRGGEARHDGGHDREDHDRDGDGVRNRDDRHPNDPRRD